MNEQEHQREWNDRLQDWLDGEPDAAFEAHLGGCARCQAQLEKMQALDEALHEGLPALTPSASFDARLFEKIDEIDEKKQLAARESAQHELQQNLQSLRRGWRRALA